MPRGWRQARLRRPRGQRLPITPAPPVPAEIRASPDHVGWLPLAAWSKVILWLSPTGPTFTKGWDQRKAVLMLRLAHPVLRTLVAQVSQGGAGILDLSSVKARNKLDGMETATLGRALLVMASLRASPQNEHLDVVQTAVQAVRRGHAILFHAEHILGHSFDPAKVKVQEALLVEAAEADLLQYAFLGSGPSDGWSLETMAKLPSFDVIEPKLDIERIIRMSMGVLQRVRLRHMLLEDTSVLRGLDEVIIVESDSLRDIEPLADVRKLEVERCGRITALPALRNSVFIIRGCMSLTDLSGLAGGRLGRLELRWLPGLTDLGPIGEMQAPPRTVILEGLPNVRDLAMLRGVPGIEVIECANLDKAATRDALGPDAAKWVKVK